MPLELKKDVVSVILVQIDPEGNKN